MRGGVSHLIHAISTANVPLNTEEKDYFYKTLLENFKHPNSEIQEEATRAFSTFAQAYFDSDFDTNNFVVLELSKMFEASKHDQNIALTRGYNMAFGCLSRKLLLHYNPTIIEVLA